VFTEAFSRLKFISEKIRLYKINIEIKINMKRLLCIAGMAFFCLLGAGKQADPSGYDLDCIGKRALSNAQVATIKALLEKYGFAKQAKEFEKHPNWQNIGEGRDFARYSWKSNQVFIGELLADDDGEEFEWLKTPEEALLVGTFEVAVRLNLAIGFEKGERGFERLNKIPYTLADRNAMGDMQCATCIQKVSDYHQKGFCEIKRQGRTGFYGCGPLLGLRMPEAYSAYAEDMKSKGRIIHSPEEVKSVIQYWGLQEKRCAFHVQAEGHQLH